MRVLVDMDGVIADFERGFLGRWKAQYPNKHFIPLKDRNTHFIVDQYPAEFRGLIEDIFHAPGFIQSLAPVPGGFAALTDMHKHHIEVFICTEQSKKRLTWQNWKEVMLSEDRFREAYFDQSATHGSNTGG